MADNWDEFHAEAAAVNRDFNDDYVQFGSESVLAAMQQATRPSGFRPLPYLDLANLAGLPVPPREWALDGMMPLNKTTLLTGNGGVGKSLLAQLLATCTALGVPFLGREVRRMPALYISWEDDHDELWRRQADICSALCQPFGEIGVGLNLVSMADQTDTVLYSIGEGGLGAPTKRGEQIMEEVDNHGGLFVFDNATHIYAGDNNSTQEVGQFAHWLNRLALPTVHSANQGPRAGLLLHHPNKQGEEFLGSVAYNNQFRSRLFMDRPDTPDRDMRRLGNPKANYAATGGEILFRWYHGSFIRDDDLPEDQRDRLAEIAGDGRDNDVFLKCLAERTRQQRAVSEKVSSSYAPTVFAGMAESQGIGKPRLAAAMDRLFRLGRIERSVLPWKHDRKAIEGLRVTCE